MFGLFVTVLYVYVQKSCSSYLWGRLEDPELLSRRECSIESDDHHWPTALWKVFSNVSTGSRQSLNLLLACHENQDVMGQRRFLLHKPEHIE